MGLNLEKERITPAFWTDFHIDHLLRFGSQKLSIRDHVVLLPITLKLRTARHVVHNQDTMALLWNPESWALRLKELEAQAGDLKEAPLRRDVRSLGMLLGEVLREQAG